MIRIIVDSQSNRLFRGIEMEQNYDQRGGLCQAGPDDIIITTNPIDQHYLDYWQKLGFSLPHLLTAGPFNSQLTLSELIIQNNYLQGKIKELVGNKAARLEFFCIEETERKLTKQLGIPAYCNFDVAIPLARKHAFKRVCDKIDLPTPEWSVCDNNKKDILQKAEKTFLSQGFPVLFKSNDGTGGISCGGMIKIETMSDLEKATPIIEKFFGPIVIEKLVQDKMLECAVHWEINENAQLNIINFFNQLSYNFSYAGTTYPAEISVDLRKLIESQLKNKLVPFLREKLAIGFFCCDIIIDKKGLPYWIDFNPRKGAILYIYDMVSSLSSIQFGKKSLYFWHEHCRVKNIDSFQKVYERLGNLLQPNKKFAVITNPGVIQYGYIDITGISQYSKNDARDVFQEARNALLV